MFLHLNQFGLHPQVQLRGTNVVQAGFRFPLPPEAVIEMLPLPSPILQRMSLAVPLI